MSNNPSLCISGCGFFGSIQWEGNCSACFKKLNKDKDGDNKPNSNNIISNAVNNSPNNLNSEISSTTAATANTTSPPSIANNVVPTTSQTAVTSEFDKLQCLGGCKFFGSKELNGYCSKCFAKPPTVAKTPVLAPVVETTPLPEIKQTNKNKCWKCTKKTGLLGFECRCGYTFCSKCRYAEDHDCPYNFQKDGKDKLAKDNIAVVGPKFTRIDSN